MRCADFDYELPRELIAQAPLPVRCDSRLLHMDVASGAIADRMMRALPDLLRPGDLLVLNDTRVIPARLRGRKESGGRIEALIERVLDDERALAQVRNGKSLRDGARVIFSEEVRARVERRAGELLELRFEDRRTVAEILLAIGRMPLPPYIMRDDGSVDRERYQTVFAERDGAVAAPTAGLHFDDYLLARVRERGIETATITLHVGAGTFQPVRTEDPREHRMHAERFEVGADACARVRATRERGGRVVAVGTTVVRALESAACSGELAQFRGETDIFITPGCEFRVVDALITNFHLPRSTLLMLVCAFAGTESVLAAYRHAVAARYRFFSYGDAMLIS
jgi:S-adenosylmethionine:tRNA ribosyltransferase-isomerase